MWRAALLRLSHGSCPSGAARKTEILWCDLSAVTAGLDQPVMQDIIAGLLLNEPGSLQAGADVSPCQPHCTRPEGVAQSLHCVRCLGIRTPREQERDRRTAPQGGRVGLLVYVH
jgi:hypothetical protein